MEKRKNRHELNQNRIVSQVRVKQPKFQTYETRLINEMTVNKINSLLNK